jgi:hypothetical protein
MPPNLRKPQPNLSKPSEGSSFNAKKKPSEETAPINNSLNLTGQRELGSAGGIKAIGRLTVGVDQLIGQQGVDIEIDATNRTAGFGVDIGSTKGKLGVNIGGKVGYDETGKLSIKGAEVGISIAGTGASASIDENEGIRGSVSVAGAKVEIGVAPDGKKNVSLCYGVPGGELCVTFEPDPGIELPAPPPPPPILRPGVGSPPGEVLPLLEDNCYYYVVALGHGAAIQQTWDKPLRRIGDHPDYPGGKWSSDGNVIKREGLKDYVSPGFIEWHDYPTRPDRAGYKINDTNFIDLVGFGSNSPAEITGVASAISYSAGVVTYIFGSGGRFTKQWINNLVGNGGAWEFSLIKIGCSGDPPGTPPVALTPVNLTPAAPPVPMNKIQLPNYPQHFKPMDCCDKVDEIYRYLGIAKLKRNKFPVSNAFLVPGKSGNDDCLDYYTIFQALFRMLANGLIINPKSKPLGSEWQDVNATAWASSMYEMMAESMSDGNSTQRFEVAAIMQMAQMMSTLAENGRKIEFVADAIGLEPLPVPEEVPICFTIYEEHKGFGKKEPKKIKSSGLKTDNDVEDALGKMLKPSLIPITAWKFKPGQISISEALRNG